MDPPPSWADWVKCGRPRAPRARHAAEISSTTEISASASRVSPYVREINCRLRNCGMLGAYIARGLKYIHVFVHTNMHVSLSTSQAGSISMLNPRWTSTPPLRGAAPLSPGSAAWHSARCLLLSCGQGNYPSFLCVRVRALVCVLCTGVWRLHRYYLSYLFSILATGQPATCEVVWGSLLSPRLWARHQVCSWPTIMRKAVRGAAYHTDYCSLVSGKGLGSGLPCVCSGCKRAWVQ